jgi:hypothetical protein
VSPGGGFIGADCCMSWRDNSTILGNSLAGNRSTAPGFVN